MRAQVLFSSGLCHSFQGLVVMTTVTEKIGELEKELLSCCSQQARETSRVPGLLAELEQLLFCVCKGVRAAAARLLLLQS